MHQPAIRQWTKLAYSCLNLIGCPQRTKSASLEALAHFGELSDCWRLPDVRGNFLLQVLLARHADDLLFNLAVLEDEQSRYRADAKLTREGLVIVDVNFADLELAVKFVGQLIEQR